MRPRTIGIAVATLVLIASAYGDAVFQSEDQQPPRKENVLFKTSQAAAVVAALTNSSDTLVQSSSTTDKLMATAHKRAKVEAAGSLFKGIAIAMPGRAFPDAAINPFQAARVGDLMVTAEMGNGSTFTFRPHKSMDDNNFLTASTINGREIVNVTIDPPSGFQARQQPRIPGVWGVAIVSQPSSMLLLGSVVLGVAYVLRRKML